MSSKKSVSLKSSRWFYMAHLKSMFCQENEKTGRKHLPKTYRTVIQNIQRILPTENYYLPSVFIRMKSLTTAFADNEHTLKGVQVGDQEWGTRCSGKNWQDRPSDSYFQEKILWAQFLAPSHIQKNAQIINGDICPSWLAAVFYCMDPLHQNHMYIDLPHCLFGTVPQSCLRGCLLDDSPHFAPNKT